MPERELAIRAAISAQAHLRTELKAPSNVWGDVARAERAVDAYAARPVVITDETVERAADAYLDAYMNRRQPDLIDVDLVAMRAALEAALNPQQ